MRTGGVILCGGRSRRMGRSKAMLPFGPESMLSRVARLVGQAVEPVVVVAAVGQELPPLPSGVRVVRDRRPARGPLEGLAAGLRAEQERCDAVFLSGCDVPFLAPAFIRRVIELLLDHDVAVPHVGGRDEPLSAVYRTSLLPQVEALLADDRLRPAFLFDVARTRRITPAELTDVDPQLESLENVNTPDHYRAALARAGLDTRRDVNR